MIAWLVTDLPDPDSPTMPSVWPRSTSKVSPSTALTTPSPVGKCTRRSRTERNAEGTVSVVVSTSMTGLVTLVLAVADARVDECVEDVHEQVSDNECDRGDD